MEGEKSGGDGGDSEEEGKGVDGEKEGGTKTEEGESVVTGLGEDMTELETGGGMAEDGFEVEDVGFERVRGERKGEEKEREREREEEKDGEEMAFVSGEDLKGMEKDFEEETERFTRRRRKMMMMRRVFSFRHFLFPPIFLLFLFPFLSFFFFGRSFIFLFF